VAEGGEKMSVEEKVKEVLLEILDVKEEDVVPTATFIDDLKATSIDLVEIFTAFQNAFDINLDEAQVAKVNTVQDAVELVKSAVAQKSSAS
jgi:acyl carrier protein